MNFGFTIKGSSIDEEHRRAAVESLLGNFILPSRAIAENIIATVIDGIDVGIYGENLDYSVLDALPFEYEMISIPSGRFLLVSAVDFKLELQLGGTLISLRPTESVNISYDEAVSFGVEVKQGLIRIFPDIRVPGGGNWILAQGVWEDGNVWDDTQTWID